MSVSIFFYACAFPHTRCLYAICSDAHNHARRYSVGALPAAAPASLLQCTAAPPLHTGLTALARHLLRMYHTTSTYGIDGGHFARRCGVCCAYGIWAFMSLPDVLCCVVACVGKDHGERFYCVWRWIRGLVVTYPHGCMVRRYHAWRRCFARHFIAFVLCVSILSRACLYSLGVPVHACVPGADQSHRSSCCCCPGLGALALVQELQHYPDGVWPVSRWTRCGSLLSDSTSEPVSMWRLAWCPRSACLGGADN
jgi:hypothetical protein